MKVAAVFWGPQPGQGRADAFTESILEALRETAAQSKHEFVYYVIAGAPGSSDMLTIPYTRRERYRRAAIYRVRDMLDQASFPRRRLHTWLERSLAEEGVDVVWFATNYVEQCDLPYLLTILDVEHVRQPWFREVSADGEWERRHHHFSRFIPKPTRVIVPNAAGRDQIVRHFGIDPERVLCLPHPTPAFAREAARREPLPRERVERLGPFTPYVPIPPSSGRTRTMQRCSTRLPSSHAAASGTSSCLPAPTKAS